MDKPLPGVNKQQGRFHVMIKPVGAACNLRCTYCYYSHKTKLLQEPVSPLMNDATLQLVISQYCEANHANEVVFSWQGGEPTLAGLDFYRKVLLYQQRFARPGQKVANTLQTNGTLIDETWAQFLKDKQFRVGLSVDGPRALHDAYRRNAAGNSCFDKVMNCHALLKKYAIPYTVLTTVNDYNVEKPREVYNFLTQDLGADYVQFNPCAEHLTLGECPPGSWPRSLQPRCGSDRLNPHHKNAVVTTWSAPALAWGDFLCQVFAEWYARDVGRVLVNWFETAVAQMLGLPAQICPCGELCGKGVAINYDGKVYSCDHYVYPQFLLGDLHTHTLTSLAFSQQQQKFAFAKQKDLPEECLNCPHGTLCWGQCPRHRFVRTSQGQVGLNYFCSGWKSFYRTAGPKLRELAALVEKRAKS